MSSPPHPLRGVLKHTSSFPLPGDDVGSPTLAKRHPCSRPSSPAVPNSASSTNSIVSGSTSFSQAGAVSGAQSSTGVPGSPRTPSSAASVVSSHSPVVSDDKSKMSQRGASPSTSSRTSRDSTAPSSRSSDAQWTLIEAGGSRAPASPHNYPDNRRQSTSGSHSPAPLPPNYERKVGFDTMTDADDTVSHTFSFTLQARSRGYRRIPNTRTFMCAVDGTQHSERALEWLVQELVEDGDEIVALRVLEGEPDEIDHEDAREEARDLMERILELNDDVGDRKISIITEHVAGRAVETILHLIFMYRPDSLTVGTRGRASSTFHKLLGGAVMGSVSRDILSRSPVPVVVVRPESKVLKHLKKRNADPKRRSYHDLIHGGTSATERTQSPLPMSINRHWRDSLGKGHHGVLGLGGHHHDKERELEVLDSLDERKDRVHFAE